MSINAIRPRRGEVWLANFEPTLGDEIRKVRPAVVISSDAVGQLAIKLVAPITDWKENFSSNIWHVMVGPTASNGLTKVSAVDALQVRSFSFQRFIRKLGYFSPAAMEEVAAAVAAVIEFI